ncbi:DMT family transporter [Anaerospora hongkongensis]|uniref:DMT family transporter n=1 Tax=Anaerospora hongkongensis TaxID=244830 RepID=UPI002896E25C|nr:DMT family transporter [Anaerospora hongkongensis]
MEDKNNRPIFLLLLFVSMLWGANVVMIKYLTHYYPPLALAPIRLTLATFLLVPFVWYKHGLQIPPRQTWLPITGVAAFTIFLHQITLNLGAAATSGTHAVLILGLNPLLTTVLASLLIKEPFTWGKGLGIILGFGGVMLVVYGKTETATLYGDGIMVGAMVTFVIGSLFVKKSTALLSPLLVTAYSHILASVGLVIVGLIANTTWFYEGAFNVWPLSLVLFSSFVCTALGAVWWNTGIQRVGASTTSVFQNGIPIFGVFAAALFLGENINWHHVAALILVLAGVSLATGVCRLNCLTADGRTQPVKEKE